VCVLLGLGNPGRRYARTRHNVAWRVLDVLAERWHAEPFETVEAYAAKRATTGGRMVHLVKPSTYMNASGLALQAWGERHPLALDSLMVISDDVYLPLGHLRMRATGSSGGHRGLESVERVLGGPDFARLRIGVGSAESSADLREHVLEEIEGAEEQHVQEATALAADAAECWLREGIGPAMNRFNRRVGKEVSES
jgi:peptidyl-tRNA hydrolase, PTH1 family